MTTDLSIQINSQQVINALDVLNSQMENMQPAFNSIGQVFKTNIRLGFTDQRSPDGINWAALSPVTVANRRNNSDVPLNDTGVLKNSFTVNTGATFVEVGTNAPQAALMNFGGTKAQFPNLWGDIPARPFMPTANLPEQWEKDVVEVIERHLSMN
jgi:phage gpG-like protein